MRDTRSPIERMIDAACGVPSNAPTRPRLDAIAVREGPCEACSLAMVAEFERMALRREMRGTNADRVRFLCWLWSRGGTEATRPIADACRAGRHAGAAP